MFFKRSTFEYIIAGLGNPGPRYDLTRHNAGFAALELLAARLGVKPDRLRFEALTAEAKIGAHRVLLVKPQTFMNLSGRSVAAAARFYKLDPDRVIVITDDVALPTGALRIRAEGSAGGHNGLKSIIAELGTEAFPRIRIGVGGDPRYELADWVLSKLTATEAASVTDAAERAAEAAAAIVTEGIAAAQSRFNGAANA